MLLARSKIYQPVRLRSPESESDWQGMPPENAEISQTPCFLFFFATFENPEEAEKKQSPTLSSVLLSHMTALANESCTSVSSLDELTIPAPS